MPSDTPSDPSIGGTPVPGPGPSRLGRVFGQWTPPPWAHRAGARARANPRRTGLGVLGLLLLLLALLGFRAWWLAHPRPAATEWKVAEPEATCFSCTPKEVHPLKVTFAAPTAPLALVGHDLPEGVITLDPKLAGRWHWADDATLEFLPKADWPVGQAFHAYFRPRQLAREGAKLSGDEIDFTSAPLKLAISEAEFHQDPRVPDDQRALFTLTSSHPLDVDSLRRHINLRYRTTLAGVDADGEDAPFTLALDAARTEAHVTAGPLKLSDDTRKLRLTLEPGLLSTLGGEGLAAPLDKELEIPGRYSLTAAVAVKVFTNEVTQEPHRALTVTFSQPVADRVARQAVKAWLLPAQNPDAEKQAQWVKDHPGQPYDWTADWSARAASLGVPALLAHADTEDETGPAAAHAFDLPPAAAPGRTLLVRIDREIQSFGGFRLKEGFEKAYKLPAYPMSVHLATPGALLMLNGEKKLSVQARGVPGVRYRVGRLLPNQLQHLVTQTEAYGSLDKLSFKNSYTFNVDNLADVRTRESALSPGAGEKPVYDVLDMGPFLPGSQGIFLLTVEGYADGHVIRQEADADAGIEAGPVADTRLVVVTDIGLLVKSSGSGDAKTMDVFTPSLATGAPKAGVKLTVLGANGLAVAEAVTDADGHARLPSLAGMDGPRQPALILATQGTDQSFLPLDGRTPELDTSRFDVGGAEDGTDAAQAYLFTDRTLYRPDEDFHLGIMIRPPGWGATGAPAPGVPLGLEITDPTSRVVHRQTVAAPAGGLTDALWHVPQTAVAGDYTASLYLPRASSTDTATQIGTVSFRVREFTPDRLRLTLAALPAREPDQGWVAPTGLQVDASLASLFGAPAESRRVTAKLTLAPGTPTFARWPGYSFGPGATLKEGFTEDLPDTRTDAQGQARLNPGLGRFGAASYKLTLVVEGYEPDGGKAVTQVLRRYVSGRAALVGTKADGGLDFIAPGASRRLHLQAIGPDAAPLALGGLKLQRLERRVSSVLVNQYDSWRYESRTHDVIVAEEPLELPAGGRDLLLPTGQPGKFSYVVVDPKANAVLARADYSIAGTADVSRSLDRNAELQLALEKPDYRPGETVRVQVNAPYTGSGLITVERDHVYAWKWFHATTTASLQEIQVPAGLEGSGYVSVSFVRDPGSPDVHTSPLSFGVVPFSVARDARTAALTLAAPAKARPGDALVAHLALAKPARVIVWAVDEGILQAARHPAPDPLGFYFQKRMLGVNTRQILDMILPEFSRLVAAGLAPGGDAGEGAGRFLNPFRRRTDPPVVFWSGVVNLPAGSRDFRYQVPESFNGELHWMALAVEDTATNTATARTRVAADVVLQPSLPLAVAPGDEFEMAVAVANRAEGSGPNAGIELALTVSPSLSIVQAPAARLTVPEGHEKTVTWRLRANNAPGNATVSLVARGAGQGGKITETLSVRPATPRLTLRRNALVGAGKSLELGDLPAFFAPFRQAGVAFSPSPLALADGLTAYLHDYPYDCTEQLVSQGFPAVVLATRPAYGRVLAGAGAKGGLAGLFEALRNRQADGGLFRYWPNPSDDPDMDVSVYVQQMLAEAGERGLAVPADLVADADAGLTDIARREGGLPELRTSARAVWLLARRGVNASAEADRVAARLATVAGGDKDIASAWLAAAFHLMQAEDRARALINRGALSRPPTLPPATIAQAPSGFGVGPMAQAEWLYIVARYFPARLSTVRPEDLTGLLDALEVDPGSLLAGEALLAFDAYDHAAGANADGGLTVTAAGRALGLADGRAALEGAPPKLLFANGTARPAFASVSLAGFPTAPPAVASHGIELVRELLGPDGKAVTSVAPGTEVTVRLRLRTLGNAPIAHVAVTDLLPGGFEVVVPPPAAPADSASADGAGAGNAEGADADDGAHADADTDDASADSGGDGAPAADPASGADADAGSAKACFICVDGTTLWPEYFDVREDRVLFFATVQPSATEIRYRLRATTVGLYILPSALAEAMYAPSVRALTPAGQLRVISPGTAPPRK